MATLTQTRLPTTSNPFRRGLEQIRAELRAYYIQGKAFLWPAAYGRVGHLRGYAEGLRRTGWIYGLVTLTLAGAAIYEALEVIYLAPLLR
ncbi:MAG: hypothetical protein ABI847_00745 [Anaerolineales bacterium]